MCGGQEARAEHHRPVPKSPRRPVVCRRTPCAKHRRRRRLVTAARRRSATCVSCLHTRTATDRRHTTFARREPRTYCFIIFYFILFTNSLELFLIWTAAAAVIVFIRLISRRSWFSHVYTHPSDFSRGPFSVRTTVYYKQHGSVRSTLRYLCSGYITRARRITLRNVFTTFNIANIIISPSFVFVFPVRAVIIVYTPKSWFAVYCDETLRQPHTNYYHIVVTSTTRDKSTVIMHFFCSYVECFYNNRLRFDPVCC